MTPKKVVAEDEVERRFQGSDEECRLSCSPSPVLELEGHPYGGRDRLHRGAVVEGAFAHYGCRQAELLQTETPRQLI